jgi:hypothetical protein
MQRCGARFAKTAMDAMFLDRDDGATFATGRKTRFSVERLDSVH